MEQHTHITALTPVPGKRYRFSFGGEPLYEATVTRAEGCWAVVRIDSPLPGKHENLYHAGDEYEVKHAMYALEELASH